MKALTVRQPWAWLIVHGSKNVENRSQQTHFRGRIAIHAGLAIAPNALDYAVVRDALDSQPDRELLAGQILGTVEIIGCHHATECGDTHAFCSDWALEDSWHWDLADPEPVVPFPAKGKLGLWNLDTSRGHGRAA